MSGCVSVTWFPVALQARDTQEVSALWKVMHELLDRRRQLITGTLTQDQTRELRLKVTAKIDWGNRSVDPRQSMEGDFGGMTKRTRVRKGVSRLLFSGIVHRKSDSRSLERWAVRPAMTCLDRLHRLTRSA